MKSFLVILIGIILSLNTADAQQPDNSNTQFFPLNSDEGLELVNVEVNAVEYKNKSGIRIIKSEGDIEDETIAIVKDSEFSNGIIEVELTGEPAPGAIPQARGFVGITFRINEENPGNYECFYLRPTNARADNQVRRNHSTQYVSHPEYPWYRLREEAPKLYESYVDLVPGEWTKMKIEVLDVTARLYVNDSEQPCLIVNDLKKGNSKGKVGLWLHSSTLAHFRNLTITSSDK